MPLAFLNLGPSEILLLLVLMLLLFGVDRLPEMARSLGRARARLDRTREQFARAMEDEESRQLREQLAFERAREHQVAQQAQAGLVPEPTPEEEASIRQAAEALGVPSAGRTVDELRAAIQQRVGRGGA